VRGARESARAVENGEITGAEKRQRGEEKARKMEETYLVYVPSRRETDEGLVRGKRDGEGMLTVLESTTF
jgi:hypothetical protein